MKKAAVGILITAVAVLGALYLYKRGVFKNSPNPKEALKELVKSDEAEWKYEKTIAEPIKKVSTTGEQATLGDLGQNAVSVVIPKGSFDSDTEVELKNPDSMPKYPGKEIDTIGAPIEISAGKPVRLNDKATITFKFDKSKFDLSSGTADLRVAYYNGTKWDYIRPLSVDLDNETITFETYHFSLLGATKIKDETVLTEDWIHSKTLDKQMRDNINKVTDHVANQIIDMGLEKMGITDKSLKGKILGEVLKENDYKDIYDAYQKGDPLELNQKLAVLVGKKMAENIPASVLQEHLKNLTADSDEIGSRVKDVAAISQAAANIAEGQYKDAAKIIGEAILDKTTVGIAGKIAVEVVKGQINDWKNSEVEAAYVAFRDGSNAKFYGYNVDKGDFNTVWDQMRGIRRQLEIEAIKKENDGRADAGLPALTEAQMDIVRDKVKTSFQNQFALRSEKEGDLKKAEDQLRLLVESFKRNNLLDSVSGPVGLDKGLDYENKLDVLNHFAEKMMDDTGRFQLSDKNGLIMDDKISVDDIAQGARIYFSGPDGKKDYAAFLKDRFNIDPFPKLSDLSGSWKGTTVITDIIFSEAAKKELENAKGPDGEGCDLSKLEEAKGKSNPLNFTLTPTSDTGGNFIANGKASPFTYADGVISTSMADQGVTGVMTLSVSQDASSYSASGTMNADYKDGLLKIVLSVNASKGKSTQKK